MAKKKKLKVALIFGGTSEEREVSLRTGSTMAFNLDPKKYDVIPVEISKEGKWLTASETIRQIGRQVKTKKVTGQELVPVEKGSEGKIDLALLALHGPGGEDGTIQGMLELLRIPYTCSGVLASALAMDKVRTKAFISALGIKAPSAILIEKDPYLRERQKYLNKIRGKVVVKPNRMGSSLGTYILSGKKSVDKAIRKAFRYDTEVLAEKFIAGTELTVPVLGNSKPVALPVVELVPLISDFFDYKAKYEVGGTDEIVPARISQQLTKQIQEISLKVHVALGCKGLTRSDFILDKHDQLWFLEINTIPGLTPTSITPRSARVAGISYSKLLDLLIKLALQKD